MYQQPCAWHWLVGVSNKEVFICSQTYHVCTRKKIHRYVALEFLSIYSSLRYFFSGIGCAFRNILRYFSQYVTYDLLITCLFFYLNKIKFISTIIFHCTNIQLKFLNQKLNYNLISRQVVFGLKINLIIYIFVTFLLWAQLMLYLLFMPILVLMLAISFTMIFYIWHNDINNKHS